MNDLSKSSQMTSAAIQDGQLALTMTRQDRNNSAIQEASQIHLFLSKAEQDLQQEARSRNMGILVTRHHFDQYSVSLHHDVPYGETWELSII